MPTYRTITLSLISQFDILTIPEYAPPTASPSSSSSHAPTLIDRNLSLVSVYIPTYPSSQFWLSYSISPPHPPHALYYFKLLINGAHIVSWGCGEEDGFKGKTMFGVFESGESWLGERGMEKRVFCFGREEDCFDGVGGVMEVRVCRARGRKRTRPEVDEFGELGRRGDGVKRGALQSGSAGRGGVGV
ncbi:MAG: hypothetical protein M1830_005634, partial [Pleopsidium flavum]